MKKFFAYLKVKQDINRGRKRQNEVLLERAKNMSLANNFVTDLTSLVVFIKPEIKSENSEVYIYASDDWEGMVVPIDGLDIASVISPEDNTAAMGPCNVFQPPYHKKTP